MGRVFNYLEKSGLAENTIVVYTSDQGVFLGEHGIYDKRFMYKEAFRTPMMVRYPNKIIQDQVVDEMVMNLDIAPTLLDLAGINIPDDMQGITMKNLLFGKQEKNWRDKMYYHYYETGYGLTAHYGMQTPRYKLIRFYDPLDAWELYDLEQDPDEINNLYNDPAYQQVIDNLKEELKQLQMQY